MTQLPVRPEYQRAIENGNLDLESRERVRRGDAAVALKIRGANYSEIAQELQFSSANAARVATEAALAASAGPEDRERLRFLEARRLERLLRSLWNKATDEDHPEHLAAIRTAIAVIDRHAKLYGLDAPQEMVVYTPAAAELEEWVARQARQVRGELPTEADVIGQIVAIEDTGYGDSDGDDGG